MSDLCIIAECDMLSMTTVNEQMLGILIGSQTMWPMLPIPENIPSSSTL